MKKSKCALFYPRISRMFKCFFYWKTRRVLHASLRLSCNFPSFSVSCIANIFPRYPQAGIPPNISPYQVALFMWGLNRGVMMANTLVYCNRACVWLTAQWLVKRWHVCVVSIHNHQLVCLRGSLVKTRSGRSVKLCAADDALKRWRLFIKLFKVAELQASYSSKEFPDRLSLTQVFSFIPFILIRSG